MTPRGQFSMARDRPRRGSCVLVVQLWFWEATSAEAFPLLNFAPGPGPWASSPQSGHLIERPEGQGWFPATGSTKRPGTAPERISPTG